MVQAACKAFLTNQIKLASVILCKKCGAVVDRANLLRYRGVGLCKHILIEAVADGCTRQGAVLSGEIDAPK